MTVSPVVTGLRKQYPGYDDIPDDDFVTAIHDAYYKDMPEEDFYKAMDDAYAPQPDMKPKASWGQNVVHAMTAAARDIPPELWKDFGGMGVGLGKGMGAHALEAVPVPAETPTELRARGFTPQQVQNVLRGNADIQQAQASELQGASEDAVKRMARGSAFMATLPIAAETAVGKKLGLANIKNVWLRHALVGALGVGAYEGVRTGLEEGSLEHVPQKAAEGAAVGALAGPILGRASEAVAAVLHVPKNIVAGYNQTSQRIAAQINEAGVARATSFVERWGQQFNADMIRNFPDIHNALANGTITPQQAAQQLVDSVRSDRPGGFLDAAALDNELTRSTLEDGIAKKLGKWWLSQPSVRHSMRNLPVPAQPVAPVSTNALLNTAAPEPHNIGTYAEPLSTNVSTGVRALPTIETGANALNMPMEAGTPFVIEGNAPPLQSKELQLSGVVPEEAVAPSFPTPEPLGAPLSMEPATTPALEPAAIELPPTPATASPVLPGPLGGLEPIAATARQAETPFVLEPAARNVADTPSVGGIEKNSVAPVGPPGSLVVSSGNWRSLTEFADESIAAAKARMAQRGVRLNAFVDPADFADAAAIGASHILKGAADFGAWSEQMLQEFGESVRPHLKTLYREAKALFAAKRSAPPAPRQEVQRIEAYLKKNHKAVNPAKATTSVHGQPFWLAPDGTLYDVQHHEVAAGRAMKAARVGSKKVGYAGTYRWENHGMLQRGFIRVQLQPNAVNMETARNATEAQRATVAKLARGRDGFMGVVVTHSGDGGQSADSWGDMRRLMDLTGGN